MMDRGNTWPVASQYVELYVTLDPRFSYPSDSGWKGLRVPAAKIEAVDSRLCFDVDFGIRRLVRLLVCGGLASQGSSPL
jgi:hypothetical protein